MIWVGILDFDGSSRLTWSDFHITPVFRPVLFPFFCGDSRFDSGEDEEEEEEFGGKKRHRSMEGGMVMDLLDIV